MTRRLDLLVAGRCNLRCSYCYQDASTARARMDSRTARAAVDALLRWSPDDLGLGFSGGEPLLELGLIRETVEYLEARRPEGSSAEYRLTTNGTLMDPETTAYLVDHDVQVQISFDGVRAAQERRARGSFDDLDDLVTRLRRTHPQFLRRCVAVEVTLSAATIPLLADSIRYFLDRGIEHIQVGTLLTWESDWCAGSEDELRRQLDEILALSLELWERERRIPVAFLRPGARHRWPPFLCSASSGDAVSVDSNGRVWGCHLFASSLQSLPALAREVAAVLDLGDIDDPGLDERLRSLPRAGLSLPVLTGLEEKSPSHGSCGACPHVADCLICPFAICHIPGNHDPKRVPDFPCAFSRITRRAAAEFRERTLGDRLIARLERLEAPLQELNKALSTSARPRTGRTS